MTKALATTQNITPILFEDARIPGGMFRNFSGEQRQYNKAGDRNFVIFLTDEQAVFYKEMGLNVKLLKPRPDDEDQYYQPMLRIAVGYKIRPPKVVVISGGMRTDLGEHEIEVLDWVDMAKADLIVRPRPYDMTDRGGSKGYKLWLKSLYVTIQEDELDRKYADVDYAPVELEFGGPPKALGRGPIEQDETEDIVDAELVED